MTRLFRWAALAAFLLPFSACDKLTEADDASETEPSVSVVLSNAVIHPLDAPDFTVATVIAKAPAKGMSLSVMILDASKNVVTESFTTDFDPRPSSSDSLFSTSDWKIATKIATPPGSYTLKVIVTDKKGHTATQTANFQVAPDADDSGPSGELGIEDWSAPDVVLTDNFSSPRGTLRFSGASVDLTVRIQTLSGTDVTDDFSLDYPREVTASPFDLSDIGVAGSRADPGDYEMILTVRTVGGKELTERGQFAVESGSEMEDDFAMEGPVTLGAQSNS
ncbi:MAG TPA: hypothetical protein PKY05_12285, partial [Fibrobacteria bacterium]|nr:hypothetical protein [Fibrobacteria bacterium]